MSLSVCLSVCLSLSLSVCLFPSLPPPPPNPADLSVQDNLEMEMPDQSFSKKGIWEGKGREGKGREGGRRGGGGGCSIIRDRL